MKNLKSLKWELGLVGALGLVILFNGIKTSPSFDQAVLTASSQSQPSVSDQFSSDAPRSNSQFNNSSNSGSSFSQSPRTVPHTRSRRS